METRAYEWRRDREEWAYEFFSHGPKGSIRKIIEFQHLWATGENSYILTLGDWIPGKKELSYLVVSDNGDKLRVLYTVVSALMDFMEWHPSATVYIEGSTKSRTRLYQMEISKNCDVIKNLFDLYGKLEDEWEEFKKGVNYKEFAIVGKLNINYSTMNPLKQDEGLVKEPEPVYEHAKSKYKHGPGYAEKMENARRLAEDPKTKEFEARIRAKQAEEAKANKGQ